ncbi:MAG: hypothetical protein HDS64_00150 [Bacteroidales bacterium]|nr:hypothetical protein [Bacteroidales bacterium]MBD5373825.1 hypothetical protein [Bacteroides sp.]
MHNSQIITDQLSAAILNEHLNNQAQQVTTRLEEIQQIAFEKMQYAQTALQGSLRCVENARDFTSDPSQILGSMHTKHGEIAEHIEVEIRNGRDILNKIKPTATFEGVGRTAPEDYIIDGAQVQSKFCNGGCKSLEHVLDHLRTYNGFTDNGYYQIPKDQYATIQKIISGESVNGISSRTIHKYKTLIQQIESESGKSFSEIVKPGLSNYNEVQLGEVDKTLDGYEREFKETSSKEIKEIRKERESESRDAQHLADPSWGEAIKYSAVAAIITGGTSAGIKIYSKLHAGKKIIEFTLEDWKEIGYDFTKGGVKGGISGLGIYGLTKLGNFSAPFAGAMVSTVIGISSLAYEYRSGTLSKSEFAECACSLSIEAGLSAVGAAIGQVVVPIPILGAIIGTATAKASLEISKYIFDKKETALIKLMQEEYDTLIQSLNSEAMIIIEQMNAYFFKLDGFIEAALNKESAVRFYGSIELCRFLDVPENIIIHNLDELNDFMLA